MMFPNRSPPINFASNSIFHLSRDPFQKMFQVKHGNIVRRFLYVVATFDLDKFLKQMANETL